MWQRHTHVLRSEHRGRVVLEGRHGDGGGCLKSTKDLHIQSHGTLRKLKSAHAFISDTKGETEEKKLGKLC